MLAFGDRVTVTADGAVLDLLAGGECEVVGLSDDGEYVGVTIDRVKLVYTLSVDQVQVQ